MALVGATGVMLLREVVPASMQAGTMCGWATYTTANYNNLAGFGKSGVTALYMGNSSGGVFTVYATAVGSATFTNPSAGQWFFWALVGRPTSHLGYLFRLGSDTAFQVGDVGDTTDPGVLDWADLLDLGGSDYWEGGRVAHVKMWNASLSEAELYRELWSARPRRLSDLVCWSPLISDYKDYSGSGAWTLSGSGTYADGPPVGWGAAPLFVPSISQIWQYGRPISDVAKGSWTASTGSDLYAMIDEEGVSDADYIRSP